MQSFVQFVENTLWFLTKAAAFVDGSSSTGFSRETLVSHNNSQFHYLWQCWKRKKKKQNKTKASAFDKTRMKIDKVNQERLEKLFNTAYFIAKENSP